MKVYVIIKGRERAPEYGKVDNPDFAVMSVHGSHKTALSAIMKQLHDLEEAAWDGNDDSTKWTKGLSYVKILEIEVQP